MLNQQVNRGVRSRDIIVPAPILGLNKKDALSAMDAGYAITMDNYMPLDNKIVLRSGYTKYVTLGQKVQTLVEYKNPSQGRFLAVSGGKVYNISSPTNVKAYSVTLEENNDKLGRIIIDTIIINMNSTFIILCIFFLLKAS